MAELQRELSKHLAKAASHLDCAVQLCGDKTSDEIDAMERRLDELVKLSEDWQIG